MAESTLRRFCEFVQIDFQDSMNNWPPIPEDMKPQFDFMGDFFKTAKENNCFLPSTPETRVDRPEYAEILDKLVARATVVYDELKACEADKCAP